MNASSATVTRIKVWAFPVLISVLGWFVVNTLTGIQEDLEAVRTDVKTLLAQSSADHIRIDNLEKRLGQLEQKILYTSTAGNNLPEPMPSSLLLWSIVGIPPQTSYQVNKRRIENRTL